MAEFSLGDEYFHYSEVAQDMGMLVGCMALRVDADFQPNNIFLLGINPLALDAQRAKNNELVFADVSVLAQDIMLPVEFASGVMRLQKAMLLLKAKQGLFPGFEPGATEVKMSSVEKFLRSRIRAIDDYFLAKRGHIVEKLESDEG